MEAPGDLFSVDPILLINAFLRDRFQPEQHSVGRLRCHGRRGIKVSTRIAKAANANVSIYEIVIAPIRCRQDPNAAPNTQDTVWPGVTPGGMAGKSGEIYSHLALAANHI